MKKVTINIEGQNIEAMRFTKRSSAEKYIAKKENREMIFFRSHEYYVSI